MEQIVGNTIVGIIFIISSLIVFFQIKGHLERKKIRKDKAEWDLIKKEENDKKMKQMEYFNSYKIPLHIKGRFLKEYPQYKNEDYPEIEKALMDFFWLFLPDNNSKHSFYTFHSKVADDLWHTFLLYSKEYREFCMNSFGRIIDHVPHTEEEPENSSFKTVLNTHRMLKKDNRTSGFDLDKKHGVDNRYNNKFINDVEESLDKSSWNRSSFDNNLLLSLGLVYGNAVADTYIPKESRETSKSSCGSAPVIGCGSSCGSKSSSKSSCGSSCGSSSSSSSSSSSCGSSCGGGCGGG
jgi:hypothetical protein